MVRYRADPPGAFFGTTFAPLFFQTYPELLSQPFFDPNAPAPTPDAEMTPPDPHGGQRPALGKIYEPRIYGFKVSERARTGPRMKWLRERPVHYSELDDVDWRGRWKNDPEGRRDMAMDVEGRAAQKEKGRLFDDDDELDEEGEDEEEEDEGAAVRATGGAAGAGAVPGKPTATWSAAAPAPGAQPGGAAGAGSAAPAAASSALPNPSPRGNVGSKTAGTQGAAVSAPRR